MPIAKNNNNIVKTAKIIEQPSPPTKATTNKKLTEEEKKKIDKEIQGVWNGMWGALKKGDADKASEYITPDSRKNYHQIHKELIKSNNN